MTQTWGKTLGLFECTRPRAYEAGPHGKTPEYRRRDPKESTLYQAIQVGLPSLLQELQSRMRRSKQGRPARRTATTDADYLQQLSRGDRKP